MNEADIAAKVVERFGARIVRSYSFRGQRRHHRAGRPA